MVQKQPHRSRWTIGAAWLIIERTRFWLLNWIELTAMVKKTALLIVATLLLTIVSMPIARRVVGQGPIEKRFEQLDSNKDGKVTRQELPQAEIFDQFDTNKDGVITRSEATRAAVGGAVRRFFRGSNESDQIEDEASPAPSPLVPVRQGPTPLKPGEHRVGSSIPDQAFHDINSVEYRLSQWSSKKAIVMVWTSTSCPISKKYIPTLLNMTQSSTADVAWVLVNPVATDKAAEMRQVAEQFGERVIYVHDQDNKLSHSFRAVTTTDAFILTSERTIAFHGAIDDQYGFGYAIDQPRHKFLSDALDATLQGKPPHVAATTAPGCTLEQAKDEQTTSAATYHNRISRIMNRYCVECHRDGGVGPFKLDTYDDVVAHAGMIAQVVDEGTMPPWFAAASDSAMVSAKKHTPWANDRSLASSEKSDLLNWLESDKPAGDPSEGISPMKVTNEWSIGKPDDIFAFSEPVAIKANGTMPYQNVIVETNLPEDRWVQAVEIQPSNPAVVHHVLVFALQAGDPESGTGDDATDERSGYWAIYVPGNSSAVYQSGFAKKLPKGSRLRFQMHYTPNGAATTDKTRIGLIYAKEPPRHEVKVVGIVDPRLNIPPGAPNHRVEATLKVPTHAKILGYLPHMHLRGKACRYEIGRPDAPVATLLDIPRYDFNWQLLYNYYEPLDVQPGDEIKFIAWYDNSANNPANPDPTKRVRWGAQTEDEMHLGYVEYYVPEAIPGETPSLRAKLIPNGSGAGLEAIFKRLDRNSDGKVSGDEIPEPQRNRILQLDSNNDGVVTLEEAKRLAR